MKKITIALLSGGISSEREVSLKSGKQVFEALDKGKYEVIQYDPMMDLNRLVAEARRIDAALVILHGPYGEDGTVQGLLDLLNIPYQGSGVLGSAVAMNKLVSKQLYEKAGLPVPPYLSIKKGGPVHTREWIAQVGLPLVVKPVSSGSSIGISIVHEEKSLEPALEQAFGYDETVLLESYIPGVEVTGGVLGNDELTALPIVEIAPGEGYHFFNYEAKYTAGATTEICPARIDPELTQQVQNYAKAAHKALFCRGYSRSDFILQNRNIFILETNTIPGMTPTSLYPQAAQAAGISFSGLLDRLIALSLEDHRRRVNPKQQLS
jgi:D-alanine-D-alanine ligase